MLEMKKEFFVKIFEWIINLNLYLYLFIFVSGCPVTIGMYKLNFSCLLNALSFQPQVKVKGSELAAELRNSPS